TAADIHAPAEYRTGSYPAPGIQGGGVSPLVIKNQSTFSTQRKKYKKINFFHYFFKKSLDFGKKWNILE
ncbi:MAG: hypothetical protein IKB71_03170, partial [Lentisphaeria bacterium]|nr:hypothetical protein [Lentisphaeria bacterium]